MVDYRVQQDKVFKALGDSSRRRMVEMLSQSERTVGDLAEPFAMTLPGASKHIRILEQAGIVVSEKRGRERLCRLNPRALNQLRDWVERYAVFWDASLDALEIALKQEIDDE